MTIRLQVDDAGVSWNDVASLFEAVRWGRREPDDLRSAFDKSSFKCFAFDNDRLGFARTIDDCKYMATVVWFPKFSSFNELADKCCKNPLAFLTRTKMRPFFLSHLGAAVPCEIEQSERLEMLDRLCHSSA
jgi:hypothetical protein